MTHPFFSALLELQQAKKRVLEAQPPVATAQRQLRTLVEVPGVQDVLFETATTTAAPMTGIGGDDAIVATIGKALRSRPTVSRRLLRERRDTCRADVPMQLAERIDVTVQLRVTADAVPELERGERWLRERFIGRIPGA